MGNAAGRQQEARSTLGTLSPRSFKDRAARLQQRRIDLHFARSRGARSRHRPVTHGLVLIIISLAAGYGLITNGGFPGRDEAFAAPITGLSMPAVNAQPQTVSSSVLHGTAGNKTLGATPALAQETMQEAERFAMLIASPTPSPALSLQEDAPLRAASEAPAPVLPPYQVYSVGEGDSVSSIAQRYGVSVESILMNNTELQNGDLLTLGQSLIIPAGDGVLHDVRYGETLSDIAARYDVEVEAITGFNANGIDDVNDITETQLLFVPGGSLPVASGGPVAEPAPEAETTSDEAEFAADEEEDDSSDDAPSTSPGGGIVSGGASSGAGLIWPVNGPISSYYGGGHPLGIDIDGFNLRGAGVGAATSGTVVFAGGNACCSYGLYVVVVSDGGIETLYAHLSSISVSVGETVAQGQQLGIIGDTGYSTGVHLHFEVIDNGVRVNPLNYLP